VPLAVIDKRPAALLKDAAKLGLVFYGNFAGAFNDAFASFILTYGYQIDGGAVAAKVAPLLVKQARTLDWRTRILGGFTIFVRGMLCNWMVSMGVVGP
jgi:formate/nitrite transporter FocA (FNT family)